MTEWHQSGRQGMPEADPRVEGGQRPEADPRVEEEQRLRAELQQMEGRYKRALADLDNYRKRSEGEIERRSQEARGSVLRDWLETLDSVERALRMEPEDQGLQAVMAQMEAVLAREGVTRLGVPGERFDPERHDAVAVRISDDITDRTIIEVTRSGFALGEKVLRPADVVVSQHERGS